MVLFIIALILVATLGYLAQTTGLCLVRGVNEAAIGKPLFLLAILFSGAFAWVSVLIALFLNRPVQFVSYDITVLSVIGGLLFGLGAAFNKGCGVSTISQLARGKIPMMATILGWLVGWVLFVPVIPSLKIGLFLITPEWHYGSLFVLSMIILVFVYNLDKSNKTIWRGMLVIGLMASIVFVYEPKWAPSSLLKDISLSLWHSNQKSWPSIERFILIASMIGGMIAAALKTRSFKLRFPGLRQSIRHLFAGIIMGIGAVTAGGGNDTQLLLALPAFSPAGVATVLSMLVGIYLGRKIV